MGKFRFWLSYTSIRGTLHEAAIPDGDGVHARGWNAGVKVTARKRGHDEFDVYLTSGSHKTGHDVQLGTVKDTPDGPAWTPADTLAKPATKHRPASHAELPSEKPARRLTGTALYAKIVAELRAELSEDYGLPMAEYSHETLDAYSLGNDMQPILTMRFTRTSTSNTITVTEIHPSYDGTINIRGASVEMR